MYDQISCEPPRLSVSQDQGYFPNHTHCLQNQESTLFVMDKSHENKSVTHYESILFSHTDLFASLIQKSIFLRDPQSAVHWIQAWLLWSWIPLDCLPNLIVFHCYVSFNPFITKDTETILYMEINKNHTLTPHTHTETHTYTKRTFKKSTQHKSTLCFVSWSILSVQTECKLI